MNTLKLLFGLFAFGCVWLAAEARANPSTKAPEALLKIRPGEKVPGDYLSADYEAISQRYAKAKTASDELYAKLKANQLAVGDGRQVGTLAVLQSQLRRDAEYLQLRGEASGWDLIERVGELDKRLREVVNTILNLPTMNTKSLQLQLDKAVAAGLKRLPQVQALLAQQKFVQAEGELSEVFDDVVRTAIWFPTFDYKPFLLTIFQATELRRNQAVAELKSIIEGGPDLMGLQMGLDKAAGELSSSGQCTWNGRTTSGPDLLSSFQLSWPQLQAGHKRSTMAASTIDQITGDASQYQALVAAHGQFAQALPAALVRLIQSDTQRVPPGEAAALYSQYVLACAGLCAVGPRQELEAAFTPALTALATKAGLDNEVAAYREATEPLLAWKRFMARAAAKRFSAQAQPVHEWASKVCNSPHQPHSIVPAPGNIGLAKVMSSVNQVLPGVLPAGPPAAVIVGDVVPVSAAGQRWVARYQQRVFALVAAPPTDPWKAAIVQLEQQLLVNPQLPPLTLDAATALTAARLGVFESVGGPVEQLVIEPLLTRFITMPDEAGTMLPLRALGEEFDGQGVKEQGKFLSLRCDILQPAWLQNECFVLQNECFVLRP